MSEESKILKELDKLRVFTERSGILHELQVKQLKMWPYVLFDIKEHSIIPDDVKRILTFNLTFSKKEAKGADLKEKSERLESWVWSILGRQYKILIKNSRSDKVLYRGARGMDWVPPEIDIREPGEEIWSEENSKKS